MHLITIWVLFRKQVEDVAKVGVICISLGLLFSVLIRIADLIYLERRWELHQAGSADW
jgi:hypothetical protein